METDERPDSEPKSPFGDSSPVFGFSPPGAGPVDDYVLTFYDMDDTSNTEDDPVVEREYLLDFGQYDEATARLDSRLDLDMVLNLDMLVMFADRETIYDVLDTVVEGNDD